MTNELDDFLRQQQEQKKVDENERYESGQKRGAFRNAFKKILSGIVHDAMMQNLDKLRKHGHNSKMLRETKKMRYSYEKYLIRARGTGKYVILIVIGNLDLLKVCVSKEYFQHKSSPHEDIFLNKTEEQYELSEITPSFFDTLIANLMKELLSVK